MKKKLLIILFILQIILCSCAKKEEIIKIENYPIEHELEFGGVYIQISIDDFNKLGFAYGDSVNVEFDNGTSLMDIPYYNGYYVEAGQPLLIAYPGYDYIKATVNYGQDIWDEFNLKLDNSEKISLWQNNNLEEHNTATITLNEKGKYLDIQNASDIHYFDEREKYETDEIFANFRAVNMANLKENIVYRSASPCDNQHNRAPYVDNLMKQAGVKTILDLADNYNKIEKYIAKQDFNSPYFLSLYEAGTVIPISLNMNYFSDDFKLKIIDGFKAMSENEGPYLIHCTEGKDRTGFVLMLIEALAGASYEEIKDDYMLTYDNYYKINENSDPEKYYVILHRNLDVMIKTIINDDNIDFKNCDLSKYAQDYLLSNSMSIEELNKFKNCILK